MKFPIYMDYHATTPVDPEVFSAMAPYFTEIFGNASSRNHEFGWTAEAAVEKARGQVARLVGSSEKEIIFTSGATESNNLALLGVAELYREKGNHIITTTIEHKAVLDTCRHLESRGLEVTYLPVNSYGQVSTEQVIGAIRPTTLLVSVMAANNEIGTVNPIVEIGRACKEKGVLFHSDAVQAAGKIPLNVEEMGIDLLSLSAHKMYGPKGIGALYVRRKNPRVRLSAQVHGGGHERGMRSGTLNVPGIVGFGAAAVLAERFLESESSRLVRLRNKMWRAFQSEIDQISLNGHPEERLPNNLNVSFGVRDSALVTSGMREILVSSRSACTSGSSDPSHVLKGIGLSNEQANSSVRFGLGRYTTEEEVDYTISKVIEAVKCLDSH